MRKATAALVVLALGVTTVEARGDDGRWVMDADGSWIQVGPPAAEAEAAPAPAARVDGDDVPRAHDERPIRSGWGVAGGVVLTSIGGTMLLAAAFASLPIGYEGNGGGDPGAAEATVAILGAAATAGGVGLIVWGGTRVGSPRAVLSAGPGDVRLIGSF